jgi:phosphoglycolate phosphatase-like HAD superfamily hydrolase
MQIRVAHALLLVSLVWVSGCKSTPSDPLASWNDGPSKRAIVDFVKKATTEGSPGYVKPADRIAVFDNDGTLWCEQPIYFQFAFAIDRLRAMAPQHPEWQNSALHKELLTGDLQVIGKTGEKGVVELISTTHAGMTTEDFQVIVKEWLRTARHPKYDRPYNKLVYQPMLEVLAYLRANGFKTYIVSGGGAEFMRAFAEDAYGIPPEQVIGSTGVVKFELIGGKPVLVKEPKIEFVDDGPGKPVGIHRAIGRRPVMAFGNSDGDQQMLQYTTAGAGPRFALVVHHTDNVREVSYDRTSHIGKLDKALNEARAKGWTVVDMKSEWKAIFPEK